MLARTNVNNSQAFVSEVFQQYLAEVYRVQDEYFTDAVCNMADVLLINS